MTIRRLNFQNSFASQFTQTGPSSSKARVAYVTTPVYRNRPRSIFVDLRFNGNVNGHPGGEERNDIRPNWGQPGFNWQPGDEFWTGHAIYIATPFPFDGGGESIMDIHQNNSGQTQAGSGQYGPVPFQIFMGAANWNVRAKKPPPGPWQPGIPTGAYGHFELFEGPMSLALNNWSTHVVHYRLADHNNSSFGLIEYWYNGTKQGPSVTGQNFYGNVGGGRGFYIKGGIYKSAWRPNVADKPPYTGPVTRRTVYFGEWVLGDASENITTVLAALDQTGSGPGPDPDPEPCPAGFHLENGVCVPDGTDPGEPGTTVLSQFDGKSRIVPLRNVNDTQHRYDIADALNNLQNKTALRGTMEFEAGATISVVENPRIISSSTISLQPLTPNAAAAMAGLTITKEAGLIRITHASSAQEDRVFDYTIYP